MIRRPTATDGTDGEAVLVEVQFGDSVKIFDQAVGQGPFVDLDGRRHFFSRRFDFQPSSGWDTPNNSLA